MIRIVMLIVGAMIGVAFTGLVTGSGINEREHEAYRKGINVGRAQMAEELGELDMSVRESDGTVMINDKL